jgi:hypothetical protein
VVRFRHEIIHIAGGTNGGPGTFTRVRGEWDNIPEGPPNFDSEGHEILTDKDFSYSDGEDIHTDEESELTKYFNNGRWERSSQEQWYNSNTD